MRKFMFLPLLFLLAGTGSGGDGSYRSFPSSGPLLRIGILSKYLRQTRERGGGEVNILLERSLPLYDRVSGRKYRAKEIQLLYEKGSWSVRFNEAALRGTFDLIIGGSGETSFIRIERRGRRYPLPMIIRSRRGDPLIIIKEKLYRYAGDSAAAEYGRTGAAEAEAVDALARVISARSLSALRNPRHRGYDFCDLTHCQVYRGRSGGSLPVNRHRLPFYGMWHIDGTIPDTSLYFHSSCGGMTLGPGVFGMKPAGREKGIRDWLYRENRFLCRDGNSYWERVLERDDIIRLLNIPGCAPGSRRDFVEYHRERMRVVINCGGSPVAYPAETFRLKVNRVKGWSYIRSNNYRVYPGTTRESVMLKGHGLGHGAGLCQKGALELSRSGYSASEILRHYYPDIRLVSLTGDDDRSYDLSYSLFDLPSGKVIRSTSPSLLRRRFPPGSLWKLVTSLYLARYRRDLMNGYTYTCTGKSKKGSGFPERCWKRGGHGKIAFPAALSGSCNLYFASLRRMIDFREYYRFAEKLLAELGIDEKLPDVRGKKTESEMLAGLDFRMSLRLTDLIKIISLIQPYTPMENDIHRLRESFPPEARNAILNALFDTFIKGTAQFHHKKIPAPLKKQPVFSGINRKILDMKADGLWGKTSTVIDGTEKPLSYGIFAGGYGTRGVIVFLRESNGHNAAKWGKIILLSDSEGW